MEVNSALQEQDLMMFLNSTGNMNITDYLVDEKTLEDFANGVFSDLSSPPQSYDFGSSPHSSSPISSPPSSAMEDEFMDTYTLNHSSGSDVSSSDDDAPLIFSNNGIELTDLALEPQLGSSTSFSFTEFNPTDGLNLGALSTSNTIFSFDTEPLQKMEGTAFQSSCLPPLPEINLNSGNIQNEENNKNNSSPSSANATQAKKNASRSRKRTSNGSSSITEGVKFVELNDDELLALNSAEIESYIKKIHAHRNLSQAEEKELKRVRRLIKNREYAQSSRNKKKQHVELIEGKMNEVADENSRLKEKVAQLESENRTLKYQLAKIGTAMKNDPIIMERLLATAASTSSNATVHAKKRLRTSNGHTTTGAVSLFVVLFAFGLFFNWNPLNSHLSPDSSPMMGDNGLSKISVTGRIMHGACKVPDNNVMEPTFLMKLTDYMPKSLRTYLMPYIDDSYETDNQMCVESEEFEPVRNFQEKEIENVDENDKINVEEFKKIQKNIRTPVNVANVASS